jgi:predicted DNA-binding transcriptional regulator AlpA
MHSYTSKEATQLVPNNARLLRDTEVQKLTGIGKTKRGDLMRDGKFPQPIKICGGRTNYWVASEIEKFIAEQVAQHRAEQAKKLAQLASDPFNVLMSALAGKPMTALAQQQSNSR